MRGIGRASRNGLVSSSHTRNPSHNNSPLCLSRCNVDSPKGGALVPAARLQVQLASHLSRVRRTRRRADAAHLLKPPLSVKDPIEITLDVKEPTSGSAKGIGPPLVSWWNCERMLSRSMLRTLLKSPLNVKEPTSGSAKGIGPPLVSWWNCERMLSRSMSPIAPAWMGAHTLAPSSYTPSQKSNPRAALVDTPHTPQVNLVASQCRRNYATEICSC
jgi:hypothetical protein